jgi:hypothetical protein
MFSRISVSACLAAAAACSSGMADRLEPTVSLPYADRFERKALGDAWYASGGHWTVQESQLVSTGAHNAPLFLKAALPDDVVLEVDVRPQGRHVDAKVELMTDGLRHQSGYVFVLGGWDNTISTIARLDEHERGRVEKRPTAIRPGRDTHWRIEKQGGSLRWFVDGELYLEREDPNPLEGPGHDRFAFGNWKNHVAYDNLQIWPFDEAPSRGASTSTGASVRP